MNDLHEKIAQSARQIERLIEQSRQPGAGRTQSAIALRQMQKKTIIDTHWPIAWPQWPVGIKAKIEALAQKIIRRLLQWYIDPIIEQQNDFNQATFNAVQMLSNEVRMLHTELKGQTEGQAKVEALQAQLETPPQIAPHKES